MLLAAGSRAIVVVAASLAAPQVLCAHKWMHTSCISLCQQGGGPSLSPCKQGNQLR